MKRPMATSSPYKGQTSHLEMPKWHTPYKRQLVQEKYCRQQPLPSLWKRERNLCPAAADVWGGETSLFRKWKRCYLDFQKLWGEMIVKLSQENIELATLLFYHIWAWRNASVFHNQSRSPAITVASAQAKISLLKELNQVSSNEEERRSRRGPTQPWQPPEWPCYKVNFDATFDKEQNRMGM